MHSAYCIAFAMAVCRNQCFSQSLFVSLFYVCLLHSVFRLFTLLSISLNFETQTTTIHKESMGKTTNAKHCRMPTKCKEIQACIAQMTNNLEVHTRVARH